MNTLESVQNLLEENKISEAQTIVQKALTLPPSTEIPASVIQKIPHALVLLDEEAAGLLSKSNWDLKF